MNEYDALVPEQPAGNEYDALLRQEAEGLGTRARASLSGAFGANPDQHAKALGLAKREGLPTEVVARNLPEVEKRAKLNEYDGLLGNAPKTAAFVADPDNAKIAHDDLDSLAGLERAVRDFEASNSLLDQTINPLRSGVLSLGRDLGVGQLVDAARTLRAFDAIDRGETPPEVVAARRNQQDSIANQYLQADPEERAFLRQTWEGLRAGKAAGIKDLAGEIASIPRNPAADAFVKADSLWGAFDALKADPLGRAGAAGLA